MSNNTIPLPKEPYVDTSDYFEFIETELNCCKNCPLYDSINSYQPECMDCILRKHETD